MSKILKSFSFFLLVISFSINLYGGNNVAKHSYLATSGLKLPAIVASSYYDYKYACNGKDVGVKHERLKFRTIEATAELANEVSLLKFDRTTSLQVLFLFDCFRTLKYLAKYSSSIKERSKKKTSKKDVQNGPKELVPMEQLMEEFDLTKEDIENLTEDEVDKLLSDVGLVNVSLDKDSDDVDANNSSSTGSSILKKMKLATCIFLGAVESASPLMTAGFGQSVLTRYRGRNIAVVAKLLRYVICCESGLGRVGAILLLCICLGNYLYNEINMNEDVGARNQFCRLLQAIDGSLEYIGNRTQDDFRRAIEGADDCPICAEDFADKPTCCMTSCCNQVLHESCLVSSCCNRKMDGFFGDTVYLPVKCPFCRDVNPGIGGRFNFNVDRVGDRAEDGKISDGGAGDGDGE